MSKIHFQDEAGMRTLLSDDFGDWSNRVLVDQDLIDKYAEISGDYQWIHVDPERAAKESPFGKTIAHGALMVAMLTRLDSLPNVFEIVEGYSHIVNYGSNRVRFLMPVVVDSEVHARGRYKDVEVTDKGTRLTAEIHVHAVGNDTPSMIYDLIFQFR